MTTAAPPAASLAHLGVPRAPIRETYPPPLCCVNDLALVGRLGFVAGVLQKRSPARALGVVALLGTSLVPAKASAYRPFDGTEADTAGRGEFELELGPIHYYRQGPQNYLITPALVLNLGIFKDTELVVDTNELVAVGALDRGVSRVALLGDDIFVKHTFRRGILQGETGPSIAAEGGLLTPEIHGVSDIGASIDVITSYRWGFGAIHWNEWFQLTREHDADLYTGVILEGPQDWKVRPVAELYFERNFVHGNTESALVGAIWTVRKSLVLDAAVRGARVQDENAVEVRLGLTWAASIWDHEPPVRD